jgi:hypothetical protein
VVLLATIFSIAKGGEEDERDSRGTIRSNVRAARFRSGKAEHKVRNSFENRNKSFMTIVSDQYLEPAIDHLLRYQLGDLAIIFDAQECSRNLRHRDPVAMS